MEWKPEYGILIFLAFAGVTYSMTRPESQPGVSTWTRIYAQFYAFLLTVVISVGILSMLLEVHIVWASVATMFIAPVAEHFWSLWYSGQNSTKNIFQFIRRFRKTWDALDKENDSTTSENQPDT